MEEGERENRKCGDEGGYQMIEMDFSCRTEEEDKNPSGETEC